MSGLDIQPGTAKKLVARYYSNIPFFCEKSESIQTHGSVVKARSCSFRAAPRPRPADRPPEPTDAPTAAAAAALVSSMKQLRDAHLLDQYAQQGMLRFSANSSSAPGPWDGLWVAPVQSCAIATSYTCRLRLRG